MKNDSIEKRVIQLEYCIIDLKDMVRGTEKNLNLAKIITTKNYNIFNSFFLI